MLKGQGFRGKSRPESIRDSGKENSQQKKSKIENLQSKI